MLEKEGYEVKVLDLINMEKSYGYNPFHYIQDDKDVLKLITNLIRNTTPKGLQSTEPFWEKAETALLEALCLYLLEEAPENEEEHVPIAFIVKNADCVFDDAELIERVKKECQQLLKENEIPKHIVVENELKYTDNNKYDFRFYECKGREYVEALGLDKDNLRGSATYIRK